MKKLGPEIKALHIIQKIALRSIIPIICSIVIGFLFYRWNVFDPGGPTFQFVQSAALASVFYYSRIYAGKRNAYAVLLMLFLGVLLESHSTRLMYVLRDFFSTGALAAAVLLYVRQLRSNPGLKGQYGGLVFSGILGVCTMVAWSLQYAFVQFVFRDHPPIPFMYFIRIAASYGFPIGLGVGAGIAINWKILGRAHGAGTGP